MRILSNIYANLAKGRVFVLEKYKQCSMKSIVGEMEFKDKVRMVRARLFLTQGQLAKALGCTLATVNRWETGKKLPGFILEEKFKKFCADNNIISLTDIAKYKT
jgi:DNA-binding XRE family transcriptional regulator